VETRSQAGNEASEVVNLIKSDHVLVNSVSRQPFVHARARLRSDSGSGRTRVCRLNRTLIASSVRVRAFVCCQLYEEYQSSKDADVKHAKSRQIIEEIVKHSGKEEIALVSGDGDTTNAQRHRWRAHGKQSQRAADLFRFASLACCSYVVWFSIRSCARFANSAM
jgi:hypothetical protein